MCGAHVSRPLATMKLSAAVPFALLLLRVADAATLRAQRAQRIDGQGAAYLQVSETATLGATQGATISQSPPAPFAVAPVAGLDLPAMPPPLELPPLPSLPAADMISPAPGPLPLGPATAMSHAPPAPPPCDPEEEAMPLLPLPALASPYGGPSPGPAPVMMVAPGPAPGPAPALEPPGPLQDCFDVPEAICIQGNGGREFVLTPPAAVPDLVFWYQFDKSLPVDENGRGLHLLDEHRELSPVPYGPGVLGKGGSAYFDGIKYRIVPTQPALEAAVPCFTITMWIYLLEDSIGAWRTIFNKAAGPDQLAPALLLWPDERRLHLRVAPRADWNQGALDSTGHIPLKRWTHVAVSCTGSVLRLYINGLKDGEVILEGPAAEDLAGDLYLGRDPWRAGTKAYMDDFRWYDRELAGGEVKALTYPSLTGMSSDFVRLGCASCNFVDAVKSCGSSGHLCSLQELLAGGFHAARAMGWLSKQPEVWYHNQQHGDVFSGVLKLGLCCDY